MVPFEGRWLRPEEEDELEIELPEDIEEQIKIRTYRIDEKFDEQAPRLAGALLWLAVNYYKIYLKDGLKDPPYMQKWMDDYWKKNDSYTSFIAERLENPMISIACKECKSSGQSPEDEKTACKKCDGKKFVDEIDTTKSLAAYDLYPEFKRWFYETYPNKRKDQMPDKKKFTTIMSGKDKLKEQHKRRWWGVALRKVNQLEE